MSVILPLLLGIPVSLALAAFTQLLHKRLRVRSFLRWMHGRFRLLAAGSLSIYGLFLLYTGLLGNLIPALCVTAVSVGMLAYSNYLMLRYRNEALVPRDLSMILSIDRLIAMISPASTALMLTGILAVAGLTWLLHLLTGLEPVPLSARLILGGSGLVLLLLFCRGGKEGSVARRFLAAAGADFEPYTRQGGSYGSYSRNGYIAGFLGECGKPLMQPPEGYSREGILEIASRFPAAKEAGKMPRRPHILLIMSESFSDPLWRPGLTLSEDPIPLTRALMERTPSGRVLTPGYGGGTAHCEFEVLTGFSTGLTGGISPFENGVNRCQVFPALPRQLLEQGYRTVALHPYKKGMYARTEAYRAMGFQEFIDIQGMTCLGRPDNSPFVSDDAACRQVLEYLSAADRPLFLHLVTMQNHGDYGRAGRFHTTIQAREMEGVTGRIALENYLQGIRYTDTATAAFLDRLSGLEEEVLVLFWGDHLPGGIYLPSGNAVPDFETPFFLWSNRGLPHRDLGLRSPMLLTSLLKESAGLSLSPQDRFLLEFQQELRGLHVRFCIDGKGRSLSRDGLSPQAARLLWELQMLQYDAMIGGRYSMEQDFFRMG